MGKAKRKPRPAMPRWYWLGQDGCWFCERRNNCNQCKANRSAMKERGSTKRYKGRPLEARKDRKHDFD